MGDRGNVFFVDSDSGKQLGGIYMYTHWAGSVLPAILRAALSRGEGRWGDSQYLARIVFCELVQESVLDETGFGLSTQICDNEHAVIRVDDRKQLVSFHVPGDEREPKSKGIASWTYAAFVAAGDKALLDAFAPELEEDEDEVVVPKATAKKQPAAKQPAAKQPAAKQPAAKQPAAKPPVAKQPITKQPAAKQPAKQPAAKQPAAKQPAAKQPAAKPPAAKPPAAKQPAAKQPAAKQPVAKQPAKQPVAKPPVAKPPVAKPPVAKPPVAKHAKKK